MTDDTHLRSMTARPTHPGEVLREVVLPAMGLSRQQASEKAGIDLIEFAFLLDGHLQVDDALAGKLGELCGNGAGLWLRMQATVDAWDAMHSDVILAWDATGRAGELVLERLPGEGDVELASRQALYSEILGPLASAGPGEGHEARRRFLSEGGPGDEANDLMDETLQAGRRQPPGGF